MAFPFLDAMSRGINASNNALNAISNHPFSSDNAGIAAFQQIDGVANSVNQEMRQGQATPWELNTAGQGVQELAAARTSLNVPNPGQNLNYAQNQILGARSLFTSAYNQRATDIGEPIYRG